MKIQVTVNKDQIVFLFDKPMRLDVFAVSDAASRMQWELKPSYMHPAPVSSDFIVGIAGSARSVTEASLHRNDAPSADEESVPRITEIRYGLVPEGYREMSAPRKLEKGKTYAVLAFDEIGDSENVHFSL